jgi:uncharacterized protein YegP (UPF0339 family)
VSELFITRVRVYRDARGEWRATAFASNGEPIFVTSEGYKRRIDAVRASSSSFPEAEIEIEGKR